MAHQAASDSLLTGKIFFQIREKIYNGDISADHIGKIWGLSVGGTMNVPLYTGPNMVNAANDKENTPSSGANGPSTPSTASVGLVTTPAAAQSHNTNGNSILQNAGPMTPGGGGGVFGSFSFQHR